jgi:hypothetical protein
MLLVSSTEIFNTDTLSENFELTINDCAREGKISQDCKTFNFESLNIHESQKGLCLRAFGISCLEKKAEKSCQAGEEAARKRRECDAHESDTFKVFDTREVSPIRL